MGCVAVWHAAGCRKPDVASLATVIDHEISPWPARVGAATVTLRMSDTGGHAVHGARIALEGDMTHPGMRPEFGEAREIAAGLYQGRLAFTMAGDWVVLMHIKLPGGQKLERQLEVKGVRAN
jgi:hypothetical protein